MTKLIQVDRFKCLGATLALALAVMVAGGASAQEAVRYYDQSGHNVSGAFLEFFDAHGGIALFGYPITEAFEDPDSKIVQYFQRARFEWDAAAGAVRLGDLGLELRRPDPPRRPEDFSPAERYFPETGQAIGWEFREFFEANGGEAIFGLPITGLLIEDEVVVQYFERARFEWRYYETPDRPVHLTDLGSAAFRRSGLDPRLLRAVSAPGGRQRLVTALSGRASVASAVLAADQAQTVFFALEDQVGDPVEDATVRVEGESAGRTLFALEMPRTDGRGLSTLTFEVIDAAPGDMVVLRITASRDGLSTTAETSFRVWW